MAIRLEFLSAEDDGRGHWVVYFRKTITEPDSDDVVVEGSHGFPYDTLEWRAAEYGIDPSDVDTLMDIVLTEPYLTPEDYLPGTTLHDAPSVEEARAAHIARCARVKLNNRMATRGKAVSADPLLLVKRDSPMNEEALEIKRELVVRGREHRRKQIGTETQRGNAEEQRLSQLRQIRDHHRKMKP